MLCTQRYLLFTFLIIATVLVEPTFSKHFRGGTISWKSTGGYEVDFFFKLGWTYGLGPGCTETKIGQYVSEINVGKKTPYWQCLRGCGKSATNLHLTHYHCMAADKVEGWEQGQDTFRYRFSNPGPFLVGYVGNQWIQMGNGKGKGDWQVATTVDLRTRSDIGRPNSSPVGLSQALYQMQFGCSHELKIQTRDPDGDRVRCRWAVGDECQSVCDSLPGATLDQDKCTIKFVASSKDYVDGAYYAITLTIEDFPRAKILLDGKETKTTIDSLSSVPLQFLVQTPSSSISCNAKPEFIPPTPEEGSTILAQVGDEISVEIVANNDNDPGRTMRSIQILGHVGIQQSKLAEIPGAFKSKRYVKKLTWKTKKGEEGKHLTCANAANDKGKTADPRCFTINIVSDPCIPKACNLGSCISSSGVITCTCPDGYTGSRCETDIDECASKPCKNGGKCTDHINSYTCDCAPGYTDTGCDTEIDECAVEPCQNGATCNDLINNYICICAPGYTDNHCTEDINECSPGPCQNGGICEDMINAYNCICQPGYTGVDCETDIDDCATSPCENGGTCIDLINDYDCECPSGFKGTNCDIGVDFCNPDNPCQNGGICENSFTGAVCNCVHGWEGSACTKRSFDSSAIGTDGSDASVTCKQFLEYGDCSCHLSPYTEHKKGLRQIRDIVGLLTGFPIGLGLSLCTFLLYRRCSSRRVNSFKFRRLFSQSSASSRTNGWLNDGMPSVESTETAMPEVNEPMKRSPANQNPTHRMMRSPLDRPQRLSRATRQTPSSKMAASRASVTIYHSSANLGESYM